MSVFEIFSIHNILFSFFGYDMSLLELLGTLFNLWAVWLSTKENIWTWPIGLVAVILFGLLFYQIQLYSDLIEQGYYFVSGFYGWWLWSRRNKLKPDERTVKISHASRMWLLVSSVIVLVGTVFMGYFMSKVHLFMPSLVLAPASFPYLDAFTTILSFVGQIYVAYKKIECWWIWVVVNTIGVWLYFIKGVWLVSGLFLVFLILSFRGYISWRKLQRQAQTL